MPDKRRKESGNKAVEKSAPASPDEKPLEKKIPRKMRGIFF
jgi:hypothetical protein